MALSARRTKFVDEYCLIPNISAAARAAGYAVSSSRVTGHRLLTNANVKAAIAVKKQEMAQEYEITKQTVINELLEAVAMARQKSDAGSMIRAWCEIAKIMGFYAPEVVSAVSGAENDVLRAKIKSMSDDELYALAKVN